MELILAGIVPMILLDVENAQMLLSVFSAVISISKLEEVVISVSTQ